MIEIATTTDKPICAWCEEGAVDHRPMLILWTYDNEHYHPGCLGVAAAELLEEAKDRETALIASLRKINNAVCVEIAQIAC